MEESRNKQGAAATTPVAVAAACKPLTTFIHADSNNFKEVVQRLTSPSKGSNSSSGAIAITAPKLAGIKRPVAKLHERRQYSRSKLEIVKPITTPTSIQQLKEKEQPSQAMDFLSADSQRCLLVSPSKLGGSSFVFLPSPLGTPSGYFSNLSLMEDEDHTKVKDSSFPDHMINSQEEDEAIKERRFSLHPSPRSRPGYTEPVLLSLFPLTSPKSSN